MRCNELRLAQENHATVKPRSSSSSVSPRGMKPCSESRIELQNLQILKKMLEKSSKCLSSEQPCEPKSLNVALILQELRKYPRKNCGWGQPRGHLIRSSFE